jgi:hypothetical protein
MGMFAETAIVNYCLSFANQENLYIPVMFSANKRKFAVSIFKYYLFLGEIVIFLSYLALILASILTILWVTEIADVEVMMTLIHKTIH